MRFVMAGDKSRYHFFRSIVEQNRLKNREIFFTERLGEKEVFLTSDLKKINEDVFYSPKIPLNTELYFPSEYLELLDVIKNDDKIIWFDEFPYATDRGVEQLEKILNAGNVGQVVIVLFQSPRENLETDISTDDMALEEAEFRYSQYDVSIYKYILNGFPDFLLWESNTEEMLLKASFFSKVKNVKSNLEAFDSSYEFLFNDSGESGYSLASIIDFDVLASFCEYDRKMKDNNVWKIYHDRAYKFYWSNNYELKDFCTFIYKDAIENICIWDFEKDFEKLYDNIVEEFKRMIDDMERLTYDGTKADYDEFLRTYQEDIITYKTRIQSFFTEKMKDIIRARIHSNLVRLEELFA